MFTVPVGAPPVPRTYQQCIQAIVGALSGAAPLVLNNLRENTVGAIPPVTCPILTPLPDWTTLVLALDAPRRARVPYECLDNDNLLVRIATDNRMHEFTTLMPQLPGLLTNVPPRLAGMVAQTLAERTTGEAFGQAFIGPSYQCDTITVATFGFLGNMCLTQTSTIPSQPWTVDVWMQSHVLAGLDKKTKSQHVTAAAFGGPLTQ